MDKMNNKMDRLLIQSGTNGFDFDIEKPDPQSDFARVVSVASTGPASQAGLRSGYSILTVGETSVKGMDVDALRSIIDSAARFGELRLTVLKTEQNNTEILSSKPETNSPIMPTSGLMSEALEQVERLTDQHQQHPSPPLNLRLIHKQAYSRPLDEVATKSTVYANTVKPADKSPPIPNLLNTPCPQISFKPKYNPRNSAPYTTLDPTPHLGAVAKLAIDGGLTRDQLLQIGCTDPSESTRLSQVKPPTDRSDPVCDPLHPVVTDSVYPPDFIPGRSGKLIPNHPYRVVCTPTTFSSSVTRLSPQRLTRPVHYSTYQPIHLNRNAAIQERHHGLSIVSPAHTKSAISTMASTTTTTRIPPSRGHHTTWCPSGSGRRGSFPLQLTRVGGLVTSTTVTTGTSTSTTTTADDYDLNQLSSPKPKHFQSISAYTSPTGVLHTVSQASAFFSCSDSPSRANTPPIPPATTTTDVVRLGPGDTVTRVPGGLTVFSPHSLIRMHYSPQPYVSMGSTDLECRSPIVSSLTIYQSNNTNASLTVPVDQDGEISGAQSDLGTSNPSNYYCVNNDTKVSTSTSISSTVIPRPIPKRMPTGSPLRSSAPESSVSTEDNKSHSSSWNDYVAHHPKASHLSSSPCPQVARTVRHLRRIRHIFGDSLGYATSATSASMGALSGTEKDTNSQPDLGEIRSLGSRSVESVRPSSLLCNCTIVPNGSSDPKMQLIQPAGWTTSGVISTLIRMDHSTIDPTEQPSNWEDYYVVLCDDSLVFTRTNFHPENPTNEVLSHFHVPLSTENLSWHIPTELTNIELPTGTPKKVTIQTTTTTAVTMANRSPTTDTSHIIAASAKTASAPTLSSGPSAVNPIVGVLRCHLLHLTCYLYFPDRQAASCMFTRLGPPSVQDNETPKPANFLAQIVRPRFAFGRFSLGLAGPPGALPLMKAAGTAAASIGMPLAECHGSWMQSRDSNSSLPISSSFTANAAANGEISKSKADNVGSPNIAPVPRPKLGKTKDYKLAQPCQRGRGRLQQALNRMRRAATASCDPTSRSSSGVETRRYASSHGAFGKTKSGFDTPSTHRTEPEESAGSIDIEGSPKAISQSTGHSPPAVLLAASVSPSPSLQTPCLTYVQLENSPTNGLDPTEASCDHPTNSLPSATEYPSLVPMDLATESKITDPLSVIVTDSPTNAATSKHSGRTSLISSSESLRLSTDALHSQRSELLYPTFIPLPVPTHGPLPLHKCPRSTLSPFVPFVVELCVTLVEKYGLNCVGLYRLSGSKVAHDFITGELSKNIADIDVTSDKWNDLHAMCGVLKTYLRNLPDSLFPKVMYPDFLAACRLPQRERRLLSIQRLLSIMECYPFHPEYRAHRATLRYLATHLARVSAREAVNKMTAYNLALVFAPNLVQPFEDTPELLMSDSKYKIMLVETVIKYHAWIFSPDLGLESGCSVPPDSTEDLSTANQSELEISGRTLYETSVDSEDPAPQPGRLEGDVQPLVEELLHAAASLPPPPSDTDLETAEEPGPESDRPSDIAALALPRPRFTSIPTSSWSAVATASVSELPLTSCTSESTSLLSGPVAHDSLVALHVRSTNMSITRRTESTVEVDSQTTFQGSVTRPVPLASHLGPKLDSLRHLSQGCLDQYSTEARELGARVAERRRQLQSTVAQRLHAEQLLLEARGETLDSDLFPVQDQTIQVTDTVTSVPSLFAPGSSSAVKITFSTVTVKNEESQETPCILPPRTT